MFHLHDHLSKLLTLSPMVIRQCKHPQAGLQIELPGVYAAFGLNPLNVAQYSQILGLKALMREYLFESKTACVESLLGQYWSGAKYERANYHDEIPRVDAVCDFGVRYYTFADGPQMIKNAGPDSVFKDRLIFKVFNAPGHWLLDLKFFSQFLQERGLATAHERNTRSFSQLALSERLSKLLHTVQPSIVM